MKHFFTSLVILFSFVIITGSALAQTNLLSNGDLELLKPNFWDKMGGTSEMASPSLA